MSITRRFLLKLTPLLFWRGSTSSLSAAEARVALPYGEAYPQLDSLAVGEWWKAGQPSTKKAPLPPAMNVARDEVVAFALYTHDHGVLKLSAQFFPLKPDEARTARLELQRDGVWTEVATEAILYPGWSAHFRLENWDATRNVAYRVRHGDKAMFEGLIRRDPQDKDEIVIANMSCNSSRTGGLRPEIVDHLRTQDPDLLFFAGDQTYRHTEHTAGWLEFGLQFRDVMRDRPTICIPDDHDVGQPNLWGENGKQCFREDGTDGGFLYPAAYVNQVQRQQAWNLPDPVDPAPVEQGITVYYTRLRVGGVDFAIIEDRKFKSGPFGKIPVMGPRPDHINDPAYDPATVDLPGLQLLGERQEKFLHDWSQDWTGTEMKAVLSATSFCGAVHMHGKADNRLLADLDCNGWPQTPRNRALEEIRRAWAVHLCGDQHLAVMTKQGIKEHGDGPYSFTSPALVNTTYGRWWHPLDEKAGPNPVPDSPLPWTGDFKDGLGNKLSMMAYANPTDIKDERQRADGYGLARFDKTTRKITFECWPRFPDAKAGERAQFPGWPITVAMENNDGRQVAGWLPELVFENGANPVVQVIEDATGDILYTVRTRGGRFHPRVYSTGKHTIKLGADKPDVQTIAALEPKPKAESGQQSVKI
jgi:hypothetical protein